MKIAVTVFLIAAALITGLILYGRESWQKGIDNLSNSMDESSFNPELRIVDFSSIDNLPVPVQRYLRTELHEGQPYITGAEVVHSGSFNMGEPGRDKWVPFTSVQNIRIYSPGFIWNARIHTAPGMTAFVYDAYVAGKGALKAKLLGLITVMAMPESTELSEGELMRYLAEAAWYPTALLPESGVEWEAVDAHLAKARLRDGERTVELIFTFDDEDHISSVYSDGRYRDGGTGQVEKTPWFGHFWNYTRVNGVTIPLDGEVSWILPEGEYSYWQGHIESVEYYSSEEKCPPGTSGS